MIKLPREVIPSKYRTGQQRADGSESWAQRFIYPAGWTSSDHRKVAVVEGDPGWPAARTHWIGDGGACAAILFVVCLVVLNWLVLGEDAAADAADAPSPGPKILPSIEGPGPAPSIGV
jgi:hypothetical protein